MEINYKDAIEAVKNCESNRLPIILDILRNAGYEFSQESICTALSGGAGRAKRASITRVKKEIQWEETDDELVERLREAYMLGASFTLISRLACVNRTAMYEYMHCKRNIPAYCREPLERALNSIFKPQ